MQERGVVALGTLEVYTMSGRPEKIREWIFTVSHSPRQNKHPVKSAGSKLKPKDELLQST